MIKFQRQTISVFTLLAITSCASQLPSEGAYQESFLNGEHCEATKIEFELIGTPDEYWKSLLENSTKIANEIIISDSFAQMCQTTKMNKTRGKTVQEVCREMACSGTALLKFGFFNDKDSSAIAREVGNGTIEFNIARSNSDAGNPGNIAHEFTHTLGYKHFTNFSWLGMYSVPYEVGGIVNKLSDQ